MAGDKSTSYVSGSRLVETFCFALGLYVICMFITPCLV